MHLGTTPCLSNCDVRIHIILVGISPFKKTHFHYKFLMSFDQHYKHVKEQNQEMSAKPPLFA
jgi:hypothetical protein